MGVPNRVKLFAWRFGLDSLPTREKLARRRILDEATCPFWQIRTEDLAHAIIECLEIARLATTHATTGSSEDNAITTLPPSTST